jgi:hypothetical protein
MRKVSLEKCQKLIGPSSSELTELELRNLRDVLYTLADAISDCFINLKDIDQALLNPPGDAIDCLSAMERSSEELNGRLLTK